MNLRYITRKDKETSFEINRISQHIEVISKSYTEKNRNRLSRYVKNIEITRAVHPRDETVVATN